MLSSFRRERLREEQALWTSAGGCTTLFHHQRAVWTRSASDRNCGNQELSVAGAFKGAKMPSRTLHLSIQ